jgi:drug/metabolite transporter (DMT)-like permease
LIEHAFDWLPARARGPAWMVVACVSFAFLWVCIRLIAQELHPFAVVVWRNFVGLAWLTPMLLTTPGLLRFERFPAHLTRATSGVVATFATFYAVANGPLATVLAINYSAPLFATVGAVLFLGERIRQRRIGALLIGFSGVLMVLRPGYEPLTPALIAAVISAVATAFSYVAIKRLTGSDDARAVTAWAFLITTPISMLLAAPFWTWPGAHLWPLIVAMGACAAAGQLALSFALAQADASALLPLDFVRFGLISAAGVLLFGERYDVWTLAGGCVIIASTVLLALRERATGRARGSGTPDT